MKKLLLLTCAALIAVSVSAEDQKITATNKCCKTKAEVKTVCEKPSTTTTCVAISSKVDTKQYKKDQILTLVRVGKVGKKDVKESKAWIEKNIYPPISVNVKKLRYSKKFADMNVLFAELNKMNKDNLAIVALVAETPNGISISNSVNIANNVGIVYIKPYKTKYAKDNPKLELYKWRVNKEVLKASALALGLEECPFPRCCLSPDYDDARIDEKGRNLCPPCWKKMYELMKSKGITEPLPPHMKKDTKK
jgi:predicted Zn-dependent protease